MIASLGGERRGPLPEEAAPGTVSHGPEVAREVGHTCSAGGGVSAAQQMICVVVEISDGPATRRVRVTALSIRQALALALAGGGRPGRDVRLVLPIDPEAFFAPDGLLHQAPTVAGNPEIPVRGPGAASTGPASGTLRSSSQRGKGEEHPPSEEAGPQRRREPALLASVQEATSGSES